MTTIDTPLTQPAVVAGRQPVVKRQRPFAVTYTYILWFVVLMDPHRWLAEVTHVGPLQQMETILLLPYLLMIFFRLPMALRSGTDRSVLFPPFLAFMILGLITIPMATNVGVAKDQMKTIVFLYIFLLGSFLFIDTPKRVVPLVGIYVGQYLWWNLHAGKSGGVWWHPTNFNPDSFGPLDLMGVPTAFFFGQAIRSPKWRLWTMVGLTSWCLLGVISSVARGTGLSAVVVLGLMFYRYPNKLQAMKAVVIGGLLIFISTTFLFSGSSISGRGSRGFWTEMASAFTEGSKEGTGNDRWELWKASLRVWELQPIIGAGVNNFGPTAASLIHPGEIGGDYKWNPRTLYDRQLHNIYFQLLSELGLAGMAILAWLLIDFWRRNRAMRRADFGARWRERTGGAYELKFLSFGLEGAMIAFLLTGNFYNQLYNPWLFLLTALNLALYDFSKAPRKPVQRRGVHRRMTQTTESTVLTAPTQ